LLYFSEEYSNERLLSSSRRFKDLLLTALVFIIGWAMREAAKRAQNRDTLLEVVDNVEAAVRATKQTYVDAIKKASADGNLTDLEKAQAFALTKDTVMKTLGSVGLDAVKRLGEDWLRTRIESKVQELGDRTHRRACSRHPARLVCR
jgi:predicted transcriptional regulator